MASISSTRSLVALVGAVLVGMTGFGAFLPIFPFLALHLGATPTSATIAMGAYSLGQLIASPFWGRLSDRVGRKPILVAGLLGGAASYLLLARAESVEALGAARLFGGLMAGNVGAAFAAAADLADERTRARNMGFLGAAVGFGFIAGPALGGFAIGGAASEAGFERVCLISAALAAAAALLALLLFRESLPREQRSTSSAPRSRRWELLGARPVLARFVAVMFLMIAAQALMESTFGLWAERVLRWGPSEVAWILAGLGVGAVLLQGGGAGRMARLFGERLTLLVGLALFVAGFGGLAAASSAPSLIAAMIILVLGVGLSTPALNSLIASQAHEQERGAVMGMAQSAAALGRVAGPLCAGAIFDHWGPPAPFVAGALVLLAALFVAMGGAPVAERAAAV